MKIGMRLPAPPGERFVSHAFDSNVGKPMQVVLPDGVHTGVITAAHVTDDGTAVDYTVTIIEIRIGAPRA